MNGDDDIGEWTNYVMDELIDRLIKKDPAKYAWLKESQKASKRADGIPEMILGKPTVINNELPEIGEIILGDFGDLPITQLAPPALADDEKGERLVGVIRLFDGMRFLLSAKFIGTRIDSDIMRGLLQGASLAYEGDGLDIGLFKLDPEDVILTELRIKHL